MSNKHGYKTWDFRIKWLEKWFKIRKEKIDKTIDWLQGKGALMGFFGFPVVGVGMLVALNFIFSRFKALKLNECFSEFIFSSVAGITLK